mgnify:CR=1 FL=1
MTLLSVLRLAVAPLVSLFIFELGNGFFPTLLSLQLSVQGHSDLIIGCVAGSFYGGLLLGAFSIEPIIGRFGHIRAFAAFASGLTVLCMLNGMFDNIIFWILIRFIGGIATAGVFIVIESWLLCVSSVETRGQILSFYMMSFYAAQAVGQLILKLESSEHLFFFAITAMLCSASVIPLSMTRVMLPEYDEPDAMNMKELYQKTASGMVGAFCGGLIMGALYSLLPVVLNDLFHSSSRVSEYMFVMILGGMILQFPIGKLSDVIERRIVIIFVCIGIIAVCLLIQHYLLPSWQLMLLITLFGGLTFTLYPLSISYACDSIESNQIVAVIQGMLIAYSVGAMIGPFVAPFFMGAFSTKGLFIFVILIALSLTVFLLYRKTQSVSMPQEEPFRLVPQITPIMTELDPRQEGE